jgi:tetratricopeptide (TPR) repeat protein
VLKIRENFCTFCVFLFILTISVINMGCVGNNSSTSDTVTTMPTTSLVITAIPTTNQTIIPSTSTTLYPEQESYQKGLDLYKKGDYQGAIDAFNTTISLNKTNFNANIWRGQAYYEIGQGKKYEARGEGEFRQAISDFDTALNSGLDSNIRRDLLIKRGFSHYWIGWIRANLHYLIGKYSFSSFDAAGKDFTEVLEINPNDADALTGRTMSYVFLGAGSTEIHYPYNETISNLAIDDSKKALELAPENGWAHYARSLVLESNEKLPPAESINQLDQAIRDNPEESLFYSVRAKHKIFIKDYESARRDLSKAIELQPRSLHAYTVLGSLDLNDNKLEDALVEAQKGLEINPEMSTLWLNFAIGQEVLCPKTIACYEEVLKSVDRAVEADPDKPDAHHERYILLWNLNRMAEARNEVEIIKSYRGIYNFEAIDPEYIRWLEEVTDDPYYNPSFRPKYQS